MFLRGKGYSGKICSQRPQDDQDTMPMSSRGDSSGRGIDWAKAPGWMIAARNVRGIAISQTSWSEAEWSTTGREGLDFTHPEVGMERALSTRGMLSGVDRVERK